MKARTLLKKLTDYGLAVSTNDDKIRLSPRHLVNAKVIEFVNKYKEELIAALYQDHQEKKNVLGPRVQILRVLMKNKFNNQRASMTEGEFWEYVEKHLDDELTKHGYDLEKAIDYHRGLFLDENFDRYGVCKQCRYMPRFCVCRREINCVNEV